MYICPISKFAKVLNPSTLFYVIHYLDKLVPLHLLIIPLHVLQGSLMDSQDLERVQVKKKHILTVGTVYELFPVYRSRTNEYTYCTVANTPGVTGFTQILSIFGAVCIRYAYFLVLVL